MDGSIRLCARDRKALLELYPRGTDREQGPRAQIRQLLDDGMTLPVVAAKFLTSTATIHRWRRRYQRDGVAAVNGARSWRSRMRESWLALILSCAGRRNHCRMGGEHSRRRAENSCSLTFRALPLRQSSLLYSTKSTPCCPIWASHCSHTLLHSNDQGLRSSKPAPSGSLNDFSSRLFKVTQSIRTAIVSRRRFDDENRQTTTSQRSTGRCSQTA